MIFVFSLSSGVLYCGNKIIIITGNYDQRKLEPKLRGHFHMKQKAACRFCSSAVEPRLVEEGYISMSNSALLFLFKKN